MAERENFVSAQQLAQTLGLSRSGLLALVKRGQLPRGYKVGHSRRWLVNEVLDWLRTQQTGATA